MTPKSVLIVLCVIVLITVQEISCGSVLVGKLKRINAARLRIKRQTGPYVAAAASPYVYPAAAPAAAGGSFVPALPALPDTSNVFSSLNSVTGITQQIPNLTGGQKPAAPVYQAPAAAAPAASSGGGKGSGADDEPDEDEDND